MPDFYSPLPQIQVPNGLNTLGSMMNIANSAQQLRNSQQEYQRGGVALQKEQALLQPGIRAGEASATTAEQQASQQKLVTLRAHVANTGSQLLDLLGTGATPDQVKDILIKNATNAGAPQSAIEQMLSQLPTDPAQVDKFIVNKAKGALDMTTQLDKQFPAPAMVDQGQYKVPIASGNSALTGVPAGQIQGMAVKNQITPTQQIITGTDAQGRPIATTIDPNTMQPSVSGVPVTDKPNATPPAVLPLGKTQAQLDQYTARQQEVSDAAARVPDQHYANKQIKAVLDSGGIFAPTGSNANLVRELGSAIGSPLGSDNATNINTINHFLALQTQANEKAMGVNTDAGRSVSSSAAGSSVQDPVSLRRTVNINDATASALDFYNRGKEAAIKGYQGQPGMGVFAQQDFQNAWTQAYGRYGPYAMRLLNAGQTGDKAEADAVIKELGGKKSPQFQQMLFDANKLDNLATKGRP
jgi:hypothetical protein